MHDFWEMIFHYSPFCLFWTWSNTLQGQHIVMAHLDDTNFRVGTPLSFPSSSGHRSEHDHLLLYNWSLDPEICHNMILVLE